MLCIILLVRMIWNFETGWRKWFRNREWKYLSNKHRNFFSMLLVDLVLADCCLSNDLNSENLNLHATITVYISIIMLLLQFESPICLFKFSHTIFLFSLHIFPLTKANIYISTDWSAFRNMILFLFLLLIYFFIFWNSLVNK